MMGLCGMHAFVAEVALCDHKKQRKGTTKSSFSSSFLESILFQLNPPTFLPPRHVEHFFKFPAFELESLFAAFSLSFFVLLLLFLAQCEGETFDGAFTRTCSSVFSSSVRSNARTLAWKAFMISSSHLSALVWFRLSSLLAGNLCLLEVGDNSSNCMLQSNPQWTRCGKNSELLRAFVSH